jgi:very-short-patch-repair endonuclease
LNTSFILPDFFVKNKGKIIEFDGTYYHRPTPENLLRESIRDRNIINSGYKVLHISESEYKKDKQSVLYKCLDFLDKL